MRRSLAIGLLTILACCSKSVGQQPESSGIDVFSYLLGFHGFKPIMIFDELAEQPEDALLVLFGKLTPDTVDAAELKDFRDRGGSILVASGRPDRELLRHLGVAITGDMVRQEPPEFKGDSKCPLLRERLHEDHPLWRNCSRGLATNTPSYLRVLPKCRLETLAMFPDNCATDSKLIFLPGPNYLMASSEQVKKGRVVVMAGHGVFINSMLLMNDTDNLDIAVNCIRWLGERPDGERRGKVLFLVDGVPITSFELPDEIKPKLSKDEMLRKILRDLKKSRQLANAVLQELERNGVLQGFISDLATRDQVLRVLVLAGGVMLLCYGGWRLSRGRFRVETKVPLLIDPVVDAEARTPSLLQQRFQAQADQGNLAEPAQALAREWFWRHAGIAPARWDEPSFAAPACVIEGSWWQRWQTRRLLKLLGTFGADFTAQPLSVRRFRKLCRQLDLLTDAVRSGRVRFA